MTPKLAFFASKYAPKRAQNDAKWASPILLSFWARFGGVLDAEGVGSGVILGLAEGEIKAEGLLSNLAYFSGIKL